MCRYCRQNDKSQAILFTFKCLAHAKICFACTHFVFQCCYMLPCFLPKLLTACSYRRYLFNFFTSAVINFVVYSNPVTGCDHWHRYNFMIGARELNLRKQTSSSETSHKTCWIDLFYSWLGTW